MKKRSVSTSTFTPITAFADTAYQWFPYLSWRASLGVPIPSSENRGRLMDKWMLFRDLDGNRDKIGVYLREKKMICMLLISVAPGRWQMALGMPDGRFRLLRKELLFSSDLCSEKNSIQE